MRTDEHHALDAFGIAGRNLDGDPRAVAPTCQQNLILVERCQYRSRIFGMRAGVDAIGCRRRGLEEASVVPHQSRTVAKDIDQDASPGRDVRSNGVRDQKWHALAACEATRGQQSAIEGSNRLFFGLR
jgi:hypothetical protein